MFLNLIYYKYIQKYLNSQLFLQKFNKIDKLNKFEPIICDEAIRFVSSEDWAKCLSGDTIIKTLEGNIKIKELINKKNIKLYTYNENTMP